jgi:hypothetical protein
VNEPRFRDPAVEMLVQWINAHCHEPADAADTVRPLIDAIQTGMGQQLLRNLHRTRAYHAKTGSLTPDELLQAGAVISLIRHTAGMSDEPGQPVERPARRSGIGQRLRGGG